MTILFADLVDSTRAFLSLSARHAEKLRTAHLALLGRQVAATDGDVVKTMGDGLMAVFAAASDALDCASAMQRATAAAGRRSDVRLGLRVGVSAGDALQAEGGDWQGRPVIEAARLCSSAGTGQSLATDLAVGLAEPRNAKPLPPLSLKGFDHPVPVREVPWEPEKGAPLRVLLADDAALVRDGLAQLLEAVGIEVVARLADARDLHREAERLQPDVVVSDVRMPPDENGGLHATLAIRRDMPSIAVLLLSTRVEPHVGQRLLEHGRAGVGYLSKDRVGAVSEFVAALQTVASGGCVLDDQLATAQHMSE